MVNIGFHIRTGGDLIGAPFKVRELGGECFQFFARSPHGGKVNKIEEAVANQFQENCRENKLENYYIHAPYFINFASKNNRIFYGSIKAIQDDIERAKILGAKYVITHIGSARDFVENGELFSNDSHLLNGFRMERNFSPQAFERVVEGLTKTVAGENKTPLLIEIAAGSGAVLGVNFEEIGYYLEKVPQISGFCFDTAHAYASGIEFSTEESLKLMFKSIEKNIGKEKLKLIHVNDSQGAFSSRVDRHAHIGEGKIGSEPFKFLMDYLVKENYNVDIILETPTSEGVIRDLKLLKKYRDGN